MNEKSEWKFLSKVNFWVMCFGALNVVLLDPSVPPLPWYVLMAIKFFGLVSAGFVTKQSIDRYGDKKVQSAQTNTLSAPVYTDSAASGMPDL